MLSRAYHQAFSCFIKVPRAVITTHAQRSHKTNLPSGSGVEETLPGLFTAL